MNQLHRPDFNALPVEEDSFIGRAVAVGRHYGKLPERFMDGLMGYLRVRALHQAQRQRTGIRLGREALEKAMRQDRRCLDLGLAQRAGNDVNAAVELLTGGDFEALRQCGWELAFARLAAMRTQARQWGRERELALLPETRRQVAVWATVVPETWNGLDMEKQQTAVDPLTDWAALDEVAARLALLRALPRAAIEELLVVQTDGMSFAHLLRRIVLAVALERERLTIDEKLVRHFARTCFSQGRMLTQVRQRVLEQVAHFLAKALLDEVVRKRIYDQFEREIVALENAENPAWLLLPPHFTDSEDEERARFAARFDLEALLDETEEEDGMTPP